MAAELAAPAQRSALAMRVATGLVLVAVAVAAVWFGGLAFTALVALSVLLMFSEWAVMFRLGRVLRLIGLAVIAFAIFALTAAPAGDAVILLAGGAGLAGIFARRFQPRAAFWLASGILYCGLPAIALLWLRAPAGGLYATLWVLAVVWATDIAAYFTGRAIGGAKLMPSVSPNKTWAGAIGGVIVAGLAGAAMAAWYLGGRPAAGLGWTAAFGAIAAGLAVLAVLGDLLESGLKRRAGVKDSGTLLPGHGGVLDRLDGLVPVACAAALLFAATGWAR